MGIDKPAGIGIFPLYLRDPVIFLKIIPEKSPAHLHAEIRISGRISSSALPRSSGSTGSFKVTEIRKTWLTFSFAITGKIFCRVVQPSPPVFPSVLSHDIPPLMLLSLCCAGSHPSVLRPEIIPHAPFRMYIFRITRTRLDLLAQTSHVNIHGTHIADSEALLPQQKTEGSLWNRLCLDCRPGAPEGQIPSRSD